MRLLGVVLFVAMGLRGTTSDGITVRTVAPSLGASTATTSAGPCGPPTVYFVSAPRTGAVFTWSAPICAVIYTDNVDIALPLLSRQTVTLIRVSVRNVGVTPVRVHTFQPDDVFNAIVYGYQGPQPAAPILCCSADLYALDLPWRDAVDLEAAPALLPASWFVVSGHRTD